MKCIVHNCENEALEASNYCAGCYKKHLNLRGRRYRRPLPTAAIIGIGLIVAGIILIARILTLS